MVDTKPAEVNPADEAVRPDGTGPWKGGNRSRYKKRGNKPYGKLSSHSSFKGRCDELTGHIFDVGGTQASRYMKTKKELVEYAGRTHGAEVRRAIDNIECVRSIMEDSSPTAGMTKEKITAMDEIELTVTKELAKRHTIKLLRYDDDMKKMYSTIRGQCTEAMIQKVTADMAYSDVHERADAIGLLSIIKKICYKYQAQQFPPLAAIRANMNLYKTTQGDMTTDVEWFEQFENLLTAASACGGDLHVQGVHDYILERDYGGDKSMLNDESTSTVINRKALDLTHATIYLENANHSKYSAIKQKLENDFLMGQNNYPQTLTEAQNILVNYKQDSRPNSGNRRSGNDGIMFLQNGEPRQQRRDRNTVKCYRCGKIGHYSYENVCKPADIAAYEQQQNNGKRHQQDTSSDSAEHRQDNDSGEDMTKSGTCNINYTETVDLFNEPTYGLMYCTRGIALSNNAAGVADVNYNTILSQAKGKVNPDWLLLDNQSTVNVLCNPALLHNIRKTASTMYIYCNAGMTTTNMVGDFPGVGTVWYHPNGIANILSLSRIKEHHRVTYDSTLDNTFRMYNREGTRYREFRESKTGLYYTSLGQHSTLFINNSINTVSGNKAQYSALDQRRAHKARKMQEVLNVTDEEMLRIIDKKIIPNCPVLREDIKAANEILGPSLVALKGKTVRRPEKHVRVEISALPDGILSRYSKVELGADIMYVNGIRFFISISRHIQFGTVAMILNAKAETLQECVIDLQRLYSKRGFTIDKMNMDTQFEPIATSIIGAGITPNFVSQDEHVPEIERYIRTIKERVRGIQCTLPYKRLPGRMTIEMVASQVFWWNCLPKMTGVSETMSPRQVITGLNIDYRKHMKLRFGEYVQTHEETDNRTGNPRTIGALALRPTGNSQGGHWFYSLRTGRVINRNRWTPLPMPDDVINRVEELARNYPEGIEFRNRMGEPILGENKGVSHSDAQRQQPQPVPEDRDDDSTVDSDYVDDGVSSEGSDQLSSFESESDTGSTSTHDNAADDVQHESSEEDSLQERRAGLRPARARDYGHLKTVGFINNLNEVRRRENQNMRQYAMVLDALIEFNKDESAFYQQVHSILLTQYGMKQGIKIFGARGIEAVKTELQQLHDREVVTPVPARDLTAEQKAKALAYLMFLKEKRCGKIKGRGCADGRKQRNWMSKEDTTSPTVSVQALMLSCMIDAYEKREVATADIPGAFLQTVDKSGETHLKLEGVMLDLLSEIAPDKYEQHIKVAANGKRFLYVKCLKAIYGTLNAALLFWLKLSADLTRWGFVVNPYDWCVMNKDINGKQCTILWHVDDIKVSHHDTGVVTSILDQINKVYGKEAPLVVTRGKVHEYLGMTIDFATAGRVKFTMHDYIENMLSDLPEGMGTGEAVTPAGQHLFDINEEDPTKLSESDRVIFHTNTAKLLFLAKRARPDIQLPVAFLCTRVRDPDADDWKKLERVMKYLRGSIGLPLILGIDGSGQLRWYIDAAFAVHNDMKSHTGMAMTMGQGVVNSSSSKQKLNTRSSTEAELVGVDDEITQVIWTRHFLKEQGFSISDNIVYQDNQSAMKLAKNGKRSSGKRTRHMNIRYFFVTDRIAAKELNVEYCPTLDMIADYFTKPLQGSLFRRFRNLILGIHEHNVTEYNRLARTNIETRKHQRAIKAAADDLTKQQRMNQQQILQQQLTRGAAASAAA